MDHPFLGIRDFQLPPGEGFEASALFAETLKCYNEVIRSVQVKCEPTLQACNYRNFMHDFFSQWFRRTEAIMTERKNRPPSVAPVTESKGKKRLREGDDDAVAPGAKKHELDDDDSDDVKKEKKDDDDDDSLGSDLDDDDDDEKVNFNEYCQGIQDKIVCLFDDCKKTPKKADIRGTLRDGVIMINGMPDVLFKQMNAFFTYT